MWFINADYPIFKAKMVLPVLHEDRSSKSSLKIPISRVTMIFQLIFEFKNANFISKDPSEYIFESYSKASMNLKY